MLIFTVEKRGFPTDLLFFGKSKPVPNVYSEHTLKKLQISSPSC